jgi:fatty acid desaturase
MERNRTDYRLIGGAGERARSLGLVSAAWYKPAVPRSVMKALMVRRDSPAIRDTLVWYVLILGAGGLALASLGTAWAVPAFLLYGTVYAGPADSRWHESGHGTAFKTRWMNDLLYQVASFQVMRRPCVWRWSHARHHTDTLVTGRDLEVQAQLPISPLGLFADFVGLKLAPSEFAKMLVNATGHLSADEKSFIPETEWRRVIGQARAWVGIFVLLAGVCLYLSSWAPLLFIGLPSIYGAWLYNFFGLPQHACLPENVLDHRLNCRTVMMNRVFRFLYWNMNYHVEHHMFPTVPYHALPRLYETVKDDCPPAYPSNLAAYREIIPALLRQWRDPSYYVRRVLPAQRAVPMDNPIGVSAGGTR